MSGPLEGRSGLVAPPESSRPLTTPQGMRAEPRFLQNESYVATLTSAVRAGVQDIMSYLPASVSKSIGSSSTTGVKARVLYASFDMANIRVRGSPERHQPTLCLCLGYEDGYQIWDVHDTNNIQELVSVRNGPTKCVKLLRHPAPSDEPDPHAETRPHFVVITHEAASQQQPYVVKIASLKAHELVHTFRHRSELRVESNSRVMVLASVENITLYDLRTYTKLFSTGVCHSNPHHPTAAMALGERWVAFASGQPVPSSTVPPQSTRIATRDPTPPLGQKIASVAKDVAWDIAAGLYKVGDRGLQAVQSYLAPDTSAAPSPTSHGELPSSGTAVAAGVVMIKDILNQSVVAHFQAHSIPITAMAFNPAGSLLATASEAGQELHVHQILPAVNGNSNQPTSRLLYKLVRGFFTSAVIEHIGFNLSSRWMSVTSARGTTHIFPINPTGGPVSSASHTNKTLSRYVVPRDDGGVVTLSSFARIRHTINFPEVDDVKELPVTSHFYFGETEEDGPPPNIPHASAWGPSQRLLCFSPTGHLGYHIIRPYAMHVQGVDLDPLHVDAEALIEWNLLRSGGSPEVRTALDIGTTTAVQGRGAPGAAAASGRPGNARWLSNVEINTHAPPDRPLWQGRQFVFKTISSPGADAFGATELEVPTAEAVVPQPVSLGDVRHVIRDSSAEAMARDMRVALEANDAYGRSSSGRSPAIEHQHPGGEVMEDNEFDDMLVVSGDVPTDEQGSQAWPPIPVPTLDDLNRAWNTLRTTALATAGAAAAKAQANLYSLQGEDDASSATAAAREAHLRQQEAMQAQREKDLFDDGDIDVPTTLWSPDGDNELGHPGASVLLGGGGGGI